MNAHFVSSQTTYWNFVDDSGPLRIHFQQKKEHRLTESDCRDPAVVSEHPVLLNYKESWQALYLSGAAKDSQSVLEHLAAELANLVAPWRTSDEYLNHRADPEGLLASGSGLLLRAPESITDVAHRVLSSHGISHSIIPEHTPQETMKALIAGSSFVIARDFRIERLAQQAVQGDAPASGGDAP